MKEKLQEYARLAEILSATAVVASLIFVGFQVKQQSEETALNTRAICGERGHWQDSNIARTWYSGRRASILKACQGEVDFISQEAITMSLVASIVNLMV